MSSDAMAGYKLTEVGFIPVDWDAVCIGDVSEKVGSGITPTGGARVYKTAGRPFVRSQNVGWGRLVLDDVAYLDEDTHASFQGTEIKANDVLLNITGASIGRSAVVAAEVVGGNVNQHVCIIRTYSQKIDPHFLNSYLLSKSGQRQIESFQAGGNREGLNFQQIKSFTIPKPPLLEQKAIATALSDMDALISGLDQLIAKKRDIKQATMQQLLTGQTRLPGFSGEWKVRLLGECAVIRNQKVLPAEVPPDTLCVELENICQGAGKLLSRGAAGESSASKYCFQRGDVLFGRLRPYLRKYWLATESGICTTEIWPLVPSSGVLCNGFLFSLVRTEKFIEAASISYGTHMPRADWTVIRSIEIQLPPIEEQAAIASVLSDMDSELEALEVRRDKAKQLKQGMMQELLTGRIRLI